MRTEAPWTRSRLVFAFASALVLCLLLPLQQEGHGAQAPDYEHGLANPFTVQSRAEKALLSELTALYAAREYEALGEELQEVQPLDAYSLLTRAFILYYSAESLSFTEADKGKQKDQGTEELKKNGQTADIKPSNADSQKQEDDAENQEDGKPSNLELAYRDFRFLEMFLFHYRDALGRPGASLLERTEQRLRAIEDQEPFFLRDKAVSLDWDTFTLGRLLAWSAGILIALLGLMVLFWRWHLFFSEHGWTRSFWFRERAGFCGAGGAGPRAGPRSPAAFASRLLSRPLAALQRMGCAIPKDSCILRPEDLISKEEMRRQDGRVSLRTFRDVDSRLRGMKREDEEALQGEQRYAALIIRGRQMIQRVNTYLPLQLELVLNLPLVRKLHPFWRMAAFALCYCLLWSLLGFGERALFHQEVGGSAIRVVLGQILLVVLIIGSLNGIQMMAKKTMRGLDELVTMLESRESLDRLETWMIGLFRNPWQYFPVVVLFLICLIRAVIKEELVVCNLLFILGLIWLISPLLWMILRSFSLTNLLCQLPDLKTATNPLSPLKTLGLQSWIRIIGTYAVVGSIILTYGAAIPVVVNVLLQEPIAFRDWFWILFFLPLLLAYWIFPYFRLSDAVKAIKMQRMQILKTMISRTFEAWREAEERESDRRLRLARRPWAYGVRAAEARLAAGRSDRGFEAEAAGYKQELDQLDRYHDLFQKLDKSPESFIDFSSVLELAKVMGLPSLFVAVVTYFFV